MNKRAIFSPLPVGLFQPNVIDNDDDDDKRMSRFLLTILTSVERYDFDINNNMIIG
jgi:hypothetical protein